MADAARTAVVFVHLQPEIVAPDGAFGGLFAPEVERRGVLPACEDLAAKARAAGALVVFARIAFAPDYADLNPNLPLLQMAAGAGALKDGTPAADISPAITVTGDDVVLTHRRPGPFTDSGLEDLLRDRGITDVAVAGVATNASVEAAVRQAADLGFTVSLIADACSAADEAAHDASVASQGLFATVTDAATFLAAL